MVHPDLNLTMVYSQPNPRRYSNSDVLPTDVLHIVYVFRPSQKYTEFVRKFEEFYILQLAYYAKAQRNRGKLS